MPDDPISRNRLDDEQSPYLRQHADNPVHWQPWDGVALRAAREADQPIFLSIGYSACHWCHVMEEESFTDEAVADKLNRDFVPIKVDREERPDLDSLYQTICQQVTGRGGWPLSVWLTPDGRPFFVGTYFPREARRGSPGFLDLLSDLAETWATDREEVENRADQWSRAIAGELEATPDEPGEPPDGETLASAADAALRAADRHHGGFGTTGPKFPQPSRLHLLLEAYDETGRDAYRDVAVETLDAMADGGIYDHVGGGFHRYATDREWLVPHFEKMLYDNAEIPRAFLAGYQLTGDERYADVVRETLAFVERELTHPDGGFYSTLDARSPPLEADSGGEPTESDTHDPEGEEGRFYVWTPWEVEAAVGDEALADLFCDRYGVTEGGNFEGYSVVHVAASLSALADERETTVEEVATDLETARERAFEAREDRPRPRRDEKVLAGWNGLMVGAFAEAALTVDDRYAEVAADALSFVREHLWEPDVARDAAAAREADAGRLARRYKDGDVKGDGYLEDYAFLARGALALYEATGDVDHLAFAVDLARAIVGEFWDDEEGTLYFTPESGETLVARPQELRDQSTPASVGVAAEVMLALDHVVPGDRFGEVAAAVLGTHADRVRSNPMEHATLALAAHRHAAGPLEVTVAADEVPADWMDRVGGTYLPGRLLARRPPDEAGLDVWLDRLGLADAPPIWAGREARDGPTLYVCRSRTCSPPLSDIEEALAWVEDLGSGGGEKGGPDLPGEGDGRS